MVTPIIVLTLLMAPLGLAFILSKVRSTKLDVRKYALWGLGLCFIFFALGHAIKADGMVEMLPPWVPFRLEIIYLTGILEIMVAVALFIPKFQLNAAKVSIAIFIVFFPANMYAALNSTGLGGHQWGPIYLLIRLPLQLILIFWAYFLCIKRPNSNQSE